MILIFNLTFQLHTFCLNSTIVFLFPLMSINYSYDLFGICCIFTYLTHMFILLKFFIWKSCKQVWNFCFQILFLFFFVNVQLWDVFLFRGDTLALFWWQKNHLIIGNVLTSRTAGTTFASFLCHFRQNTSIPCAPPLVLPAPEGLWHIPNPPLTWPAENPGLSVMRFHESKC